MNYGEDLKQYFPIPIIFKNDAKSAASYEKKFGSLKDYTNAVFMCIGTGIGGAVFCNNTLLKTTRK